MTTQTLIKKLNREVGHLRKDVLEIKRIISATVIDPEGEYRPAFIKKILAREQETPRYRFISKGDFLKELHGRTK